MMQRLGATLGEVELALASLNGALRKASKTGLVRFLRPFGIQLLDQASYASSSVRAALAAITLGTLELGEDHLGKDCFEDCLQFVSRGTALRPEARRKLSHGSRKLLRLARHWTGLIVPWILAHRHRVGGRHRGERSVRGPDGYRVRRGRGRRNQ